MRLRWLVLPVLLHLCFSWIGFNPSDEGWSQAIARRLSEGQFPHRDFIISRPCLSQLLQVPLVLWGGEYTLWLVRLWGWLCVGATCWIWSGRMGASSQRTRYGLYTGSVLLSVHAFPIMAWPSLDALLLASLAIAWVNRPWGFLVGGCSPLVRQNFFPLPLLLMHGCWRQRLRQLFTFCVPAGLYALALVLEGAWHDFFIQVTSLRGQFLQAALWRYVYNPQFLMGLALGLLPRACLPALFAGLSGYLAWSLWIYPGAYLPNSFVLFGAVISLTARSYRSFAEPEERLTLRAGLGITWITAISIGYNTPALCSGILWLLLWKLTGCDSRRRGPWLLSLSLLALSLAFVYARLNYPYRDQPALQLTCDVGSVLPGGRLLLTNPQTFQALQELQRLTTDFRREGRLYVIFTDYSVHWMRAPGVNPLPSDYPQAVDLATSVELLARVQNCVLGLPAGSRILVQKHLVDLLWQERVPVSPSSGLFYPQNWVKTACHKVGDGEYFEIYEPPPHAQGLR